MGPIVALNAVIRCWQRDRVACCAVAVSLVYLAVAHLTFGNRPEQFVLCGLLIAGCAWNVKTRRFARLMLPFVLMGMVYDCLRLLQPLVMSLSIRVAGPYQVEKTLFGLGSGTARMTLNELFARYHWEVADLACGFAYMVYLYVALAFAVAIALAGRDRLLGRYGWTFFFVNVAGFATYCLCPTAPPWYVATHGLGPADITVAPSPAALVRFDAMVGFPYFAEIYRRSADVFGSIPSLHCAYPLVVLLYARELRRPWLTALLLGFYLLVMFSAVYLQHHYVLDALLGTLYAAGGYAIERRWFRADERAAAAAPA
jgi:inositol phosphorylceramide synthase catalytic subunit